MPCRPRHSAAAAGGARSAPGTALGAGGGRSGAVSCSPAQAGGRPPPIPLTSSDSAAPHPRTLVPGARKTPARPRGVGRG